MALAKRLFFAVLFLSILTEAQTTSLDPWSGNFSWYFHADLQSWIPQSYIPLNPFEITIIIIFLAWASRGRLDKRFHFERGLLFWPIVVFGSLLILSLIYGLAQGGDFNVGLEEIRSLAYAIIAYFLVGILFTHRRDLDTLAWVILIAALLMGIECIIRYEFFIPGHTVGDLDYDHEDATLLAAAIVLSVAMLLLGSTKRQKWFVICTLPIDLLGLTVTYRRAGEAALAVGLVFLALILLRVNRSLFLKIVPVTALILAIYVGVNWNCTSGALCQPARALSSQFNPDPRDASSDVYRYIENLDIKLNIQSSPLVGLGFGQQFTFYVQLPTISGWPYWHYTTHDAIFWVWMDMGAVGFLAFWWLIFSALYRSGRLTQALSAAGDNKARALLAAAACLIVMQMIVSYVDLGLTSDRVMLVLGIMLGVIGHLPGILRRSTHTDEPDYRSKSPENQIAVTLEKETPEVQVGILAHALIAGPEAPPTNLPHRPTWGQRRTNPYQGIEPRWSQENGTATGSDATSRPLSESARSIRSRPIAGGRPTTRVPSDAPVDPADELPWVTHSGG